MRATRLVLRRPARIRRHARADGSRSLGEWAAAAAASRGGRIHVTSLGCARNWVDSEHMLGAMLQEGYSPSAAPETADVIVVNTCGFIADARDESHATIAALARAKAAKAKAAGAGARGGGAAPRPRRRPPRLVVTGCLVNLDKDAVLAAHPEVDAVLGAGQVDRIARVVAELDRRDARARRPRPRGRVRARRDGRRRRQAADDGGARAARARRRARPRARRALVPRARRRAARGRDARALRVPQDRRGLPQACAYCVIPRIKGPLRSKPEADVRREARALRAAGARELVLVAQDLGDYGKDLGARGGGGALVPLLRAAARRRARRRAVVRAAALLVSGRDHGRAARAHHRARGRRRGGRRRGGRRAPAGAPAAGCCRTSTCRSSTSPTACCAACAARARARPTCAARARARGRRERARDADGRPPGRRDGDFGDLLDFVRAGGLEHAGIFSTRARRAPRPPRCPSASTCRARARRARARLAFAQLGVVRARHRRLVGARARVVVDAVPGGDERARGS